MPEYIHQYYFTPEQADASAVWASSNAKAHNIPLLSYTEEEYQIKQMLEAPLRRYTNDMLRRFIIGVEPLDRYDSYRAELERMGISQLTAVYQSAYERYMQNCSLFN